jgi:dCTP deaminase
MILTRDVIRQEIEAGRVVIDPFFADQVGPASIDLHLGDEIRVMHTGREPLPVTDEVDYRTISEVRSLQTPYPLSPGETIHGITRERITLPGDIGGWLEGRSRFARLGLMIHVTSGFRAAGRREPPGARNVERVGPDVAHPRRRAAPPDRASALRGQRRLPGTVRVPGQTVASAQGLPN